jgi:hypothetical protein
MCSDVILISGLIVSDFSGILTHCFALGMYLVSFGRQYHLGDIFFMMMHANLG